MNVSIIGTGNMAKGIGTRLVSGGHSVNFHARDNQEGKALADELQKSAKSGAKVEIKDVGSPTDEIVILAVPYPEITNLADQYRGFEAKTVVDITNPVDFKTFQLIPPAGTAGAEEVAKLMPKAKVVKAFNTTHAGTLIDGQVDGQPLDVFIAGDHQDAKDQISQLVKDGGLRPIDAGPLSNARHLEGIQLIQMSAQQQLGTNFMSALKILG